MQKQFLIGTTFSRVFSVWFGSFVPFIVLTVLCYSPLIILEPFRSPPGSLTLTWVDVTWGILSRFFLPPLLSGALTYGVIQKLSGNTVGIAGSIGVGFRRILPILGISIVVGISVLIGTVCIVIPGIYLLVVLYVAVPAGVIENEGVFPSLARSRDLVRGYWWNVFALQLLIFGVILVPSIVVGFLTAALHWSESTVLALMIFLGPIASVAPAVVYHQLRSIKEGADIEQLAAVFE